MSKLIGIIVSARRCLTIQKRISLFPSVKSAFIYAESRNPKVAGAIKCFSVLSDGSIVKCPGLCVLTSPFLTFCDITKGADTSCQVVLFSFTISKHVDGLTKIQFYFEIPVTERFSASPSLVTKPIKKQFNVQQSISFRKKYKKI